MPLLHHRGGNRSARKEAKEHQIAEEELARGNVKQWHKHEAKAHRAGSHVRGVSLAPGTEFAGTPIGNYPAGYPMGGPSPPFGNPNAMGMGMGGTMPTLGRLPNGQMVSIAPLNGNPGGPGMSGFPNGASPQQIGAAMQGGTAFGKGMNGVAPIGGVTPGYGGPDTPAAAIRNMNSPSQGPGGAMHNYPTHGSSMLPSDPYRKNVNSYGRDSNGRDKYGRDYRSRGGSWDEDDSDYDYSPTRTRRGRSGSSYLPNSYSDNAMYGYGRSSPMGLPSSYSMGADPRYDYPVAQSRHISSGMSVSSTRYLPMTEEVIIGGPVSNALTEYSSDILPPKVIVEGPAAGLVSSGSSSMGLAQSGTTTTTVLPPVPAGEMMIGGGMVGSSSFPNSIPSIVEDDGMQMLPPTIVDENGMTIQSGVSEQEIYGMMSQRQVGTPVAPPTYAADSTMESYQQTSRQEYQVDLYRGEGSYQDQARRELEELEREVPSLVDRMVVLRNRLDVHEPTVRRGTTDMPGIPRATSSRLAPDLQQAELAAVRQLQAVDATRVAALEDELLLLRRQMEDPQGVESRAELRRLETRQSQLFARKSEEESEVSRLTALRQQELARLRQMKRLAMMIEEQHEEEQKTLADLQKRSLIEDQRLNDLEEELAFHRTQLRSADTEASNNLRRMDLVSQSLSGEMKLSKSQSRSSSGRVVTPLIDEPESPPRVPRQW